MHGSTLLLMFASLVLGFTVHDAWLYLFATTFGWLCVIVLIQAWRIVNGRSGFFNRRF